MKRASLILVLGLALASAAYCGFYFLGSATECEVLEISVPVASLENIIRGKVWAWQDATRRLSKRKKDELDLIRLGESFPQLRALLPREIAAQLEASR